MIKTRDHITSVAARFESDTAEHELSVVRDEGFYRHLSYGKPRSQTMRVDVVTWPGYLAYVGDMGSFVFSRAEDMFTFFRGERINPAYWAEKVQAADRDQVREWSPELFADRAREDLSGLIADDEEGRYAGIATDFEEEVLCGIDDMSKEMAYRAIMEFEHGGCRPFQDWWEVDTDVFTYRFLWCCLALVRIIALYDALMEAR